jgi:hypothetical protein
MKNQIENWRKDNKTLSQKSEGVGKYFDKKAIIKEKEPKIKVLEHELLAFTLLSNVSSLVIHQSFKSLHGLLLCHVWSSSASSHYRFVLLPHYGASQASIGYVQTISNNIA